MFSLAAGARPEERPRIAWSIWVQTASELVLAAATLFSTKYLVTRLGAEPYGVLGMISVLAGQLGLLQLGVGPAVVRVVGEIRGAGDEQRYRAVFVAAAALGAAASLVAAAVFAAGAPGLWRSALGESSPTLPAALAGVGAATLLVGLQPSYAVVHGVLAGEQRFTCLASLRLGHGLCRLVAAVLVAHAGMGVAEVLASQAAVDLVALLVVAPVLSRSVGGWPGLADTLGEGRRLLAIGLPFALAGALATILTDVEKIVVGFGRSLIDFTYYAVPFNALMRITALPSAAAATLLPVFASRSPGHHDGAADLTRNTTRLLLMLTSLTLFPLAALAPELLELWLGSSFSVRGTQPARIVMVALLAHINVYAPHAVLRARASPLTLPLLYLGQLAIHVPVVLFCVSRWGVDGAAAAWLVRAVVDALAHRRLAARTLQSDVGKASVCWLPVVGLALCVAIFQLFPTLGAGLRLAVSGGVCFAMAQRLARPGDGAILGRILGPRPWRRGEP